MARPKQDAPAAELEHSILVTVAKDGQTIEVHPDALAQHLAIGWAEPKKESA